MSEHRPIIPTMRGGPTDFTVHQLSVFRTVAEHLSYTRAADALDLSQPAVTQQIRTLELMLGMRLFARRGRGIVLSPAGQGLRGYVERPLMLPAGPTALVQSIKSIVLRTQL